MSVNIKGIIVLGYSQTALDFSNANVEQIELFQEDLGTIIDNYASPLEYVYGQVIAQTSEVAEIPLWDLPKIDPQQFYCDMKNKFAPYNVEIKRDQAMPKLFLICQYD